MKLFDTHAHLDNAQLAPIIDDILNNTHEAGLAGIVAIGTNVASSESCLELAKNHEPVWAAVGLHPNQCRDVNQTDWKQIRRLAKHEKVVAIGETGLDRHWDHCPFAIQQPWFSKHIELSNETGKPLVIHMRDCEADILDSLRPFAERRPINGIMHSFAGKLETAQQCLEWGMHISFAGMVTFKKSDALRDVAKQIPDDRILIETDSPFLSPHPMRSQRPNQPALVKHTAECLAEIRGVDLNEFCELTTTNAQRLFGIS